MDEESIKDSIIKSFAGNLIRLGNECRDHALEVKRLKAEVEHLTSENQLVREEADRYCRLWQEAKEGKGL